jgi:hypothetical protein
VPTPDADAPRPILTHADRARLRPTVDADAFERFLTALPEEVRPGVQRAAVLHFSRNVTMADIRDFLSDAGNPDAAAAVGRAVDEAPRRDEPRPTPSEEPYLPVPVADRLFEMEPPKSPRLRALWDAIEPESSTG